MHPRIRCDSLNLPIETAVDFRGTKAKFLWNFVSTLAFKVVTIHVINEFVDQLIRASAGCAHEKQRVLLSVGETPTLQPAGRRRYMLFVVVEQAHYVVVGEAVAAVQEVEFDDEGQAFDFAAERFD